MRTRSDFAYGERMAVECVHRVGGGSGVEGFDGTIVGRGMDGERFVFIPIKGEGFCAGERGD